MFCSIDLLNFFFLPQDQTIIAFLQAALPLIVAPHIQIHLQAAWATVPPGSLETVAGGGQRGTEDTQVPEVEKQPF